MSNKRITDLTELTNPTTDDVFPVVDIASNTTTKVQLGNLPVPTSVTTALATKQDTLVSGTNIKTLNSTSLLGSGNIVLTANPSGVSGAIQFSNGSAFASDATNLFWDDTNNRLGIGTNAPTQAIELGGVAASIKLPSDGSLFLIGTRFATNNGSIYFGDVNALGTPINLIPQGGGANGSINFGAVALAQFKGKGSTSATTSLLVQNSAGTAALQVQDNLNTTLFGNLQFGNGNTYINNQSSSIVFAAVNTATADLHMIPGRQMNINNTGSYTAQASALLQVDSTTKGVLFPRMTTILRDAISSPATGLLLYNTTTNKLQCYNGSTWNDLF
jgi:hypothetical protein